MVKSEAFPHVDAMRFVGAVILVGFHWQNSLPGRDLGIAGMSGFTALLDWFFVASGFIICHVYSDLQWRDFGRFMQKRFARLAPLHYAVLLAYVAIAVAAPLAGLSFNSPEKYGPACILPQIGFFHALGDCAYSFNYPSWSISAEMLCYLAFPLLLLAYRKARWLPAAIGAAGLILASLGHMAAGNDWHAWTHQLALSAFPAFAIGVTAYGYRERLAFPYVRALAISGFAILAVAPFFGATRLGLLPLAYGVCVLAIAADATKVSTPVTRRLAACCQWSYTIYMLHALFATLVFAFLFDRVLQLGPVAKVAGMILSIPLFAAAVRLSFSHFEQPARRWISRLGDRPASAAKHPMRARVSARLRLWQLSLWRW